MRAQGWGNQTTLRGLTEGWITLYRLFRPDVVVADYSPTATLAAHIAKLPYVLIGNGFELPPATAPLPPFPGFSWATAAQAAASETVVLEHAHAVAHGFRRTGPASLSELLDPVHALLATFPGCDHYGARAEAQYIGPLLGHLNAPRIAWPEGPGPRIFACLRPDTNHVQAILGGLAACEARVICVAPGFSSQQLDPFRQASVCFSAEPVDLPPLLDADLCVTYGAEATLMTFLLAGVPQLISPWHVETFMAARKIEQLGAGVVLRGTPSAPAITSVLNRLTTYSPSTPRAQAFKQRHAGFHRDTAIAQAVAVIQGEDECTSIPGRWSGVATSIPTEAVEGAISRTFGTPRADTLFREPNVTRGTPAPGH